MATKETLSNASINALTKDGDLSEVSLKAKFFSLKTLGSFILGFLILYILSTRVDIGQMLGILRQANWALFSLAFILFYLSIVLRGIRWSVLLGNMGFHVNTKAVTEILFLSWFANVLVPAKLGDIYRAFLIKKNYRFPLTKTLGSIFTERIFDMILLFTLFGISGLLSFKAKMPQNVFQLLIISFLMTTSLILVFLFMKYFSSPIKRLIPGKLLHLYGCFEEGAVSSLAQVPRISACSMAIWFLEAARLFLVVKALQMDISIVIITFVALAASLLTTLPITPAGLGAVEFAIVFILSFFGIRSDVGLSIAILDRLISYWSIIPLGYLTFVLSKKN